MRGKFSRRKSFVGAIAVGALILVGCAGEAADSGGAVSEEDQVTELTVGVTPIANAAHLYIAMEEGFFEEEGLVVTPSTSQAAATGVPSLMNDELQVALMSSVPIVTAASQNLPIKVASGSDRYPVDEAQDTTALVVAPDSEVTEVADLEGGTVAVVGLKSAPDLALQVVLDQEDVDEDDVEVVEIPYPDMMPALESDRIDAAFLVDPFLATAREEGFKTVSRPFTDGIGGMSALGWVVSEEFAEANPATLEKFNNAIVRAGEFANENPNAVRAVLPEFTSLSQNAIEDSTIPFFDDSLETQDFEDYTDLMVEHEFIDTGFDVDELLWSYDDR